MKIIPLPMKMKETGGRFVIGPETLIRVESADPTALGVGEYLAEFLAAPLGRRLTVAGAAGAAAGRGEILLTTGGAAESLGDEGYELAATPRAVTIRARKAAGLFYGVQSLLQLLPPEVFGGAPAGGVAWDVPCVEIEDQPRFPWRGMMLEVSTHFFPVDFIKRWIDLLAMHKMNVFHWHLTDFGGWRLEIKGHPRLTEVGAWRAGDGKGWDLDSLEFPGRNDAGPVYGGFYSQAEVRDIVDYARRRFVRVVPEIEMPGHSFATLAVYPELRCPVAGNERQDAFCAGSEKTFQFLEGVLSETMELFPDAFIHVGGDEVPKNYWARCPLCQARMKAQGLKSPDELQSYFIKRIERFVSSQGRRVIGWDEILEGGLLPPHAAVMSWRGVEGGLAAAGAGHDVVMSPASHCYFDYYQSTDFSREPQRMGQLLPVEKVYAYEPIPVGLAPEKQRHILGAQGNVWTALMDTQGIVEYMTFPRLSALAEVVWSPADRREWGGFQQRLSEHFRRLDQMKVTYRNGVPRPTPELVAVFFSDAGTVAFEPPPEEGLVLRCTCDGSEPGPESPLYNNPLRLSTDAVVKAAHFRQDGQRSGVTAVTFARIQRVEPSGLEAGLEARYAEGTWQAMPPLEELQAAPVQKVDGFDLGIRRREKFSAVWFSGFIRIETAGLYTFTTGSGDGSILRIGPAAVVDNDGIHGYYECSGRVKMEAGLYPLEAGCFQGRWGADLKVFMQAPGGEKQPLPGRLLCRPAGR